MILDLCSILYYVIVIYINDLPDVVKSEVFLFADDTKIFRTIKNIQDTETLQSDLHQLGIWSDTWLLRFHPDKCKNMTIGRPPEIASNYQIMADGEYHSIEHIEHEKDIGVTIDTKLKFKKHISEKINKANSIFGTIRRAFKHLNEKNFIPIYKAMVRSQLDYAVPVWNPSLKSQIDAIENVQRRATKQIPGLKDMTYEQRLRHLNLPTLSFRRTRADMIEVYKLLHNIYDAEVSELLLLRKDVAERTSERGNNLKLFQQGSKKNIRNKSFTVRVASIWNSLPNSVVEAPSINIFKNRLDKFWTNEELMYDYKAKLTGGNQEIILKDKDTDLTIEAV